MQFIYNKENFRTLEQWEKYRIIHGNGLGGFLAVTAAFSVTRGDDGILCSAVSIPNERRMLVHRLKESVQIEGKSYNLSSQRFEDGRSEENGYQYLDSFVSDDLPVWNYRIGSIKVERTCAMIYEKNQSIVQYRLQNPTDHAVRLTADPGFYMAGKGNSWQKKHPDLICSISSQSAAVRLDKGNDEVLIVTNGKITQIPQREELLAYPADAVDGRPAAGYEAHTLEISWEISPRSTAIAELLFDGNQKSTDRKIDDLQKNKRSEGKKPEDTKPEDTEPKAGSTVLSESFKKNEITDMLLHEKERRASLLNAGNYKSPEARELSRAADLYICRKEATDGYTLMAGYPFFGDWGRDTMISLPGCMLSTGRYEQAKQILQTFLHYERNGLVPNLFPEEGKEPMYNSVDAPLLLIESIYLYVQRTGDIDFVTENWTCLCNIMHYYIEGTDYAIRMDVDGLIEAGEEKMQLTWMDVCVNGILPTPRHGKPVEVNAYWYNALRIMEEFSGRQGLSADAKAFRDIAEKTKESFLQKFWIPEKGYLRDFLSKDENFRKPAIGFNGNPELQIRCNQIWALTMSFTMLSKEQEKDVLHTVEKHLFTTRGLRTLTPGDPQYHGFYGGEQFNRDMAYHQGTIWVYPLGAFYRAYLKVQDYSSPAKAYVMQQLSDMKEMLWEGCAGQLPEIYDGDHPYESKGCYAQCWSVGEMLRVYEELESDRESKQEDYKKKDENRQADFLYIA